MANDNLFIKLKYGPISTLASTKELIDQPLVPLNAGTVYFAVDTTTHKGKLVFDAPIANGGADRIVMSTDAEKADVATRAILADEAVTARSADLIVGSYIDGVKYTGEVDINHYAVCGTGGTVAAKNVDCAGFSLKTGAKITIKFSETNLADSVTLNVNKTGSKPVYYDGVQINGNKLLAKRVYTFVYDGTAYVLVGDLDTNTTYETASNDRNGLMSSTLFTKLSHIQENATYITVSGTSPISTSDSVGDVTISHNNSGVTAGTYGVNNSTELTPGFGSKVSVPGFAVNATGHVTSASAHNVVIPATIASDKNIGLMNTTMFEKLDHVQSNATYITVAGSNPIEVSDSVGDVTISHKTSGVTANTYGTNNTTALTPGFGDTFNVIGLQVNSTGHITSAASHTVKIPATMAGTNNGGLMSKELFNKLSAIDNNATYTNISATAPIKVSSNTGDLTITHNNSGVTANTYGTNSATALTPGFGSTFSVPGFAVNATGHITSASAHTVTIPATTASADGPGLMSINDYINFHYGITIAGHNLQLGDEWTAANVRTALGLSNAMHFIGKATVAITDGSTTDPKISGYSTKTAGDVIIDKDNSYEYVWTSAGAWERLGPDGSYSLSTHGHGNINNDGTLANSSANTAVVLDASKKITFKDLTTDSPAASGTDISFIDTISQDGMGKITATKKTVRDASASQSGVVNTTTQEFAGIKKMVTGLAVINNSSNNSYNALTYIESKGNDDWGLIVNTGTYNYGINVDGSGNNLLKVGNSLLVNNTTLAVGTTSHEVTTTSHGSINPGSNKKYELGTGATRWLTTYSDTTDTGKVFIAEAVTLQYNSTTKSLDFIFA